MATRYLAILLGASLLIPISLASAAPSTKAVRAKLREALKSEKQFTRLYARLTPTQKAALLASIQSLGLDDSDADGLPDVLEESEGSAVCDDDSDDDGKFDGSEIEDRDDPKDSDSDDDGQPDGLEVESKGRIASILSPTEFTLGDRTWVIVSSTSFEKIQASELAVGVCIEVEGRPDSGNRATADKIQREDGCR